MKANKTLKIGRLALFAILFCVIVLPLVRMLFYIDGGAFKKVFGGANFGKAVWNTISAGLVATVVSIVLAYALAWALTRTGIRLRRIWSIILVMPMLIPSVSHGLGLIILFGNNGIFTNLFGWNASIYGFGGVVIGSVLYSFPVAFVMIADVLKYQDYSPYEAAKVLGVSKPRQFAAISLPFLRKPLVSVFFATFTMIVTDYGVPLSVGGQFKTLPVLLYEEAVGMLNYSSGSVIGLLLLLPAIGAFLFDLFNKDKGNSHYVTRPFVVEQNKGRDIAAYIVCTLVSLFTLAVITSFCVQAFAKRYPSDMSITFDNFAKTFKKSGAEYLINSIIMAILTAAVGTVAAFVTAYLTARTQSKTSKLLHLMSITSLAIPGLVLGLSYVIVFKQSFIYGTLVILIMVNTVHFFASPYLMAYNAFGKMNENLEDVGGILGISRMRIVLDVIVPQSKYTILEMFSYFFVNCMMTISAVSFLATSDNRPLSLLINQFETYNMVECAAVVAILIFAVNVTMKALVNIIQKIGEKKHANEKTV